jgi:nicotinate-nucleotide adenylyltransferase
VFIPSAQPPHKKGASITPFKHRLAMLTLAGACKNRFECDAIEEALPKPSYTIDTLRELRKHYNDEYCLYFMIGADAFLDILTWKSHREILQSVNIILSRRKGYDAEHLIMLLENLGYTASDGLWYGNDGNKSIYILEKIPDCLSSSVIRTMVNKGEPVQKYLPEPVMEYIQKNKLYQ